MTSRTAVLALLVPAGPAWAGAVVINELLPDPAGVDAGSEWIELHHDGAADGDVPDLLDVSGWTLEIETGAGWTVVYTFPAATILDPQDYFLLGEDLVPDADVTIPAGTLDLGAATAASDGLRLVDAFGAVVDTVIYGPNNARALTDDSGAVAISLAPKPVAGQTLGRWPDASDTDLGVDFAVLAGTPDATNGGPADTGSHEDTGLPVAAPSAPDLVLNEALVDPVGVDEGLEWIEILNRGALPVELGGWTIEAARDAVGWTRVTELPGGTIAPGQHLVVGESGVAADIQIGAGRALDLPEGTIDGVGLRLLDPDGAVVDTWIYGANNALALLDDAGAVAAPGPLPSEGEALARRPDGVDTDDSSVDLAVDPTASPGWSNDSDDSGLPDPEPVDTGAGPLRGVVINELLAVPSAGVDHTWLELRNLTGTPVDLADWTVEVATVGTWNLAYTFPVGATIDPGQWLVVGSPAVVADLVTATALGLGDGLGAADGVRLVGTSGRVEDTVIYGDANTDALLDDDGLVTASMAPLPSADAALARTPDGLDTNRSADDFAIAIPSPGVPNTVVLDTAAPIDTGFELGETGSPYVPPAPDVPTVPNHVVVNELLANPTVDGTAWIELKNTGASVESLAGWTVERGVAGGWQTAVALDALDVLPGAHALIGEEVIGGDLVLGVGERLSLGSGELEGAALRLVDDDGRVRDTVVYGIDNVLEYVDDNGDVASSLAPAAAVDIVLARLPDGADTNLSGDDFDVDDPSPGAPNEPVDTGHTGSAVDTAVADTGTPTPIDTAPEPVDSAEPVDSGEPEPPTGTAEGREPPGEAGKPELRGGCGCSTVAPASSGWLALLLLLGLRRRR